MGRLVTVDITIHSPLRLSFAMPLVLRLLSKQRDCCCPLSVIQVLLSSSNQRYTCLSLTPPNQLLFLSGLEDLFFFSVAISSSRRGSSRA
uniref:Uncharacterized protein n=1 Tax=Brassica campestris TaxID=3711 RepID=A0A3P6AIQ1_BRACM|nr:unnamed protein product [Brassica rapa]